jgi:hypothetical protein
LPALPVPLVTALMRPSVTSMVGAVSDTSPASPLPWVFVVTLLWVCCTTSLAVMVTLPALPAPVLSAVMAAPSLSWS